MDECPKYAHFIEEKEKRQRNPSSYYDDGVNWDHYNDDLDMDQQSPDFWG